jgi:hypothetical protein
MEGFSTQLEFSDEQDCVLLHIVKPTKSEA